MGFSYMVARKQKKKQDTKRVYIFLISKFSYLSHLFSFHTLLVGRFLLRLFSFPVHTLVPIITFLFPLFEFSVFIFRKPLLLTCAAVYGREGCTSSSPNFGHWGFLCFFSVSVCSSALAPSRSYFLHTFLVIILHQFLFFSCLFFLLVFFSFLPIHLDISPKAPFGLSRTPFFYHLCNFAGSFFSFFAYSTV